MVITRNDGFSIIELIVVLSIVGILLVMATINGRAWMDRYNVDGQTRKIYVDLMNARVSAMTKNRMYFVSFAPLAAAIQSYTIYEDRNPGNDALEGSGALEAAFDRVVAQVNLHSSYPYTTTGGTTLVQFDQRGMVTAGECTIATVSSFGSEYDCIEITSTRIKMGAMKGGACVIK